MFYKKRKLRVALSVFVVSEMIKYLVMCALYNYLLLLLGNRLFKELEISLVIIY